jgi:hypothetical protein
MFVEFVVTGNMRHRMRAPLAVPVVAGVPQSTSDDLPHAFSSTKLRFVQTLARTVMTVASVITHQGQQNLVEFRRICGLGKPALERGHLRT